MLQIALSLMLQLCLASLAFAAPIAGDGLSTNTVENTWQYASGGGIVGFIVLILDIIVFIEVLQSTRSPAQKLIWCLVVFLFPVVGMIIYWLFSNRDAHKPGSGYETLP